MESYKDKIEAVQDKAEMKKIVRTMLKDKKLSDYDLSTLINQSVIPKLNEIGVEIIDYDDSANLSAYETIIRAEY